MYYTTNTFTNTNITYTFFTYFSHVFLIFNHWNYDIGMLVLRSSILVQVSKKLFWINGGVQLSIGRLEKKFKN